MNKLQLLASIPILLGTTYAACAEPVAADFSCDKIREYCKHPYVMIQVEESKIVDCINRSYDPPIECRLPPGKIVTAPGAGSMATHGQPAPSDTPKKLGAAPSVSNSQWGFAVSFPPWQGFPCQLPGGTSVCGGSSSGGGASSSGGGSSSGGSTVSCPARDDTTGLFGERIPLVGLTTKALECGGSVSLYPTPFSIAADADHLAIASATNIQVYRLVTGSNKFQLVTTVPLPTQLCMPTGSHGGPEVSVELKPAISQIFAYSSATTHLPIRLQNEPGFEPFDPFDPNPDAPPEKFLVLPLIGGMPQNLTTSCAKESDYYKSTLPASNLVQIQPSGSNACEVSTLYPPGDACKNKIQIVPVDAPQLVHSPAANAEFMPIDGTSNVMAKSSENSIVMVSDNSRIRVGNTGLRIILMDGGVLALENGNLLNMNGPAEIGLGTSVKLTGGGFITDPSGSTISEVGAGTTMTPKAVFPYLIQVNKRIAIPANVLLLSKDNGDLLLPIATE